MSLPAIGSTVRQGKRNYVVVDHGCLSGSGYTCHNGANAIEALREGFTMTECLDGTTVSITEGETS